MRLHRKGRGGDISVVTIVSIVVGSPLVSVTRDEK